jgi:peptide deformylase
LIREDQENFKVYFNPKLNTSGHLSVAKKEGCLSVPGHELLVERPVEIVVEWQEIENNEFVLKEYNILGNDEARVFLHELDHLKGMNIVDRTCELNRAGKRLLLKELSQR